MGRVAEYGLKIYGQELDVLVLNKKKSRRKIIPIKGQTGIEDLVNNLDEMAEMPKTRVEPKKNEVKQISNVDLPVDKEYLDNTKVAFLDPRIIQFIKTNILSIGKKRILGDANKFCAKTDDEIIKALVVFPDNISLYDSDNNKMIFRGGILALPLTIKGDSGYPEQRFIYVGNFSKDEERSQKSYTPYHIPKSKGTFEWRTITLGYDLPVNYNKAIRVQISVNGINEILKN